MASLLIPFLAEAEGREWALGEWDCMMAVADWARAVTGRDPAQKWRGTYSDHPSRLALLNRERGGFFGLLSRGMASVGIGRAADQRAGDIGLIHVARHRGFGQGRVGAIALDPIYWWTPQPAGGALIVRPPLARVIAMWRP